MKGEILMFDTHIHSNFSTDSKMKIGEASQRAQDLNIGIIVTEHMDLLYPVPDKFIFDTEAYFNEYEKIRNERLLLGIEIGMRMDCIEESKDICIHNPFDYVIGSVHIVNGFDIYKEEYYKGRTKDEAYMEYFDCMLKCIKEYDFIDSMGHIDYIARYARYDDKEIYYDRYKETIDEILKYIADNNKAIEINTRRFNDKNAVKNLLPIYKRFSELGGRMVTIGSDAHKVQNIGDNLKTAFDMAEYCNLKVVYFKNRKLYYDKF